MASNPQAGSNGPYAGIPANANASGAGIMPSAGHYADMQTLMQNLDALSGWLQQNREDFEGLQDGLRRVEGVNGRRIAAGGVPQENGVAAEDESAQTIITLRTSLEESRARIASLEASLLASKHLHELFTTTLNETMRLIRNYTYTQQTHIADLHRHYTRLLQDARYETLEARTTHQKWQESLTTLSESTRATMDARDKDLDAPTGEPGGRDGMRAENRGLKWENKILRRLVGWSEKEETEEELEEEANLKALVDELEAKENMEQNQAQGRVGGRGSVGLGVVERVVT